MRFSIHKKSFPVYHGAQIPGAQKMYKSAVKTPLSKIFNFFDPKFLHDFEGIVKYFSARDFGVQYVHPQGTFVGCPFWPPELMPILGKIRRNFWVCHLGAPHPKIFRHAKSNDPTLHPAKISQRNSQNSQSYVRLNFGHFCILV